MGPECNRFHHHQNLQIHHRTTFLPMLCSRPSINDVSLPKCVDRSASSSSDPLSPRISCMGQVKRNNRVIGFPSSHRLALTSSRNQNNNENNHNNIVKYSKLKKFFSTKNLTTSTAVAGSSNSTAPRSCGRRRPAGVLNGANGHCRIGCNSESSSTSGCVNIVDMDPPLPVIKRTVKPGQDQGEGNSLWKRRSGGVELKGLQLQQIHHPKHHLQPTTV
ncbi:hypothetical protein UlMin_034532 [Ulmus minor]